MSCQDLFSTERDVGPVINDLTELTEIIYWLYSWILSDITCDYKKKITIDICTYLFLFDYDHFGGLNPFLTLFILWLMRSAS